MKQILSILLLACCAVPMKAQWQMQPTPNDTLQPVRILGNGKVAFSIYAPNAKEVGFGGDAMPWGKPLQFTKADNGVWTAVISDLKDGVYRYNFTVDGVKVQDPKGALSAETSALAIISDGKQFYDVRPEIPHGAIAQRYYFSKTYYSYHAPDPAFKDRAFTGYVPGMRILMDEHYVPVDTIHALASSDGYLPAGSPLDGHDFYFFSPTHWIASASYVEREVNGVKRAVGYLQEVDDGKVVFDWWSTDHPEMLEWAEAMTTFDTSYDYVHFNSVDVMPDGHWLLSFRAISTIAKVSHADGAILWALHGEAGSLYEGFSGQHYARYHQKSDGNYITVFDNGNARQPGLTRTLRLKVQEDANFISVSSRENLIEGTPSYFTQACGALLDFGTQGFVVGWGWSTVEGNCNRLVSEHAPDGSLRFELHHLLNDPMSVNPSYRCVKYE